MNDPAAMVTAPARPRRDTRGVEGLTFVLLVVLGYSIVHAGLRLLASNSLGEDDVADNLLVQTLAIGYNAPQPALYDWVLWLVQRVTGPGIASFLLIKYAALVATAGFIYMTGLRVLGERIWALLAVEAMALIYQISWRYHEGFTHAVGAMVATAATIWACERLIALGRSRDFAIIGLIAGLGIMTTLAYWVFLASIAGAMLLQPVTRARLLDRRTLTAIVLALAVASPYLWWLATTPGPLNWVKHASPHYWPNLGRGLLDAVRGPIFYLLPLIGFLPLFFPGFLRTAARDISRTVRLQGDAGLGTDATRAELDRIVLLQSLIGIGLSISGALVLGTAGYAMHDVMPLYLPAVIWLMSVARRASGNDERPRWRFTLLAAGIALLALTVRSANMFALDPVCKLCRWGIPYTGLAEALTTAGFRPGAGSSIAVVETELGGNLRAQLPSTRVHSLQAGSKVGLPEPDRPLIIVWTADRPDVEAQVAASWRGVLPPGVTVQSATTVSVPWHHLWRPTGYRHSRWRVLLVR